MFPQKESRRALRGYRELVKVDKLEFAGAPDKAELLEFAEQLS